MRCHLILTGAACSTASQVQHLDLVGPPLHQVCVIREQVHGAGQHRTGHHCTLVYYSLHSSVKMYAGLPPSSMWLMITASRLGPGAMQPCAIGHGYQDTARLDAAHLLQVSLDLQQQL